MLYRVITAYKIIQILLYLNYPFKKCKVYLYKFESEKGWKILKDQPT